MGASTPLLAVVSRCRVVVVSRGFFSGKISVPLLPDLQRCERSVLTLPHLSLVVPPFFFSSFLGLPHSNPHCLSFCMATETTRGRCLALGPFVRPGRIRLLLVAAIAAACSMFR